MIPGCMGHLLMLNSQLMEATSQLRSYLFDSLPEDWVEEFPSLVSSLLSTLQPISKFELDIRALLQLQKYSSSDDLLRTHHNSYRIPYSIDHFLVTRPSSAQAWLLFVPVCSSKPVCPLLSPN